MSTTTTETRTSAVTGEAATTAIGVTAMAWAAFLIFAFVWWRDLGVERFDEFLGRIILVGIGVVGFTATVVVAAILTRKP